MRRDIVYGRNVRELASYRTLKIVECFRKIKKKRFLVVPQDLQHNLLVEKY